MPMPAPTPSARSHANCGSASCSTVISYEDQPMMRSAVAAPFHATGSTTMRLLRKPFGESAVPAGR